MPTRLTFTMLCVLGLAFVTVGCGDESSEQPDGPGAPTPDAGSDADDPNNDAPDVDAPNNGAPDADNPDAGEPDADEPDADEPPDDEDPLQTLAGDFAGAMQRYNRAFYGVTDRALTSTERWEVHLEAHVGGLATCPQENSPSPDATMILLGLTASDAAPGDVVVGPDKGATVLDFTQGELLGGELLTRASAVTIEVIEADVCVDCLGMGAPSDPDGFITLQVEATFPEGTVSGQIHAVHCDSFDVAMP